MNIRPLADRVLVRRCEAVAVSPGGIIIPDAVQKKSERCEVVAVGAGRWLDDGTNAPMAVKTGDVVMIPQWRGDEVTLDGVDMLFVKEDECFAVFE